MNNDNPFIIGLISLSLLFIIFLIYFSPTVELSEVLYEDGIVEKVVFCPSKSELVMGNSFSNSSGFGMGSGGYGYNIGGGVQVSYKMVPEKFEVVLKLKNKSFTFDDEETYKKFKNYKGKIVKVVYRGVYHVKYGKKDGKKYIIERKLADYQFVNATPKPLNKNW